MSRRHLPALLRSLLVATLLFAGCARRETPASVGLRTKTLLLGNGAEPADLDPQVVTAYTDMNILVALFEGLTTLDELTAAPQPGVAERWETSADGLVWTFHLRADARWSNGAPLTAEDFVYSFRRILAPKLASEYAYMLWPLANAQAFNEGKLADPAALGVRALDPRTLQLTLAQPCPWLLALTAHQAWFPVHRATIEKFGAMDQRGTRWTRPENFVGNGPFALKEWTPNARLVVAKNPHYWDAAHNRLSSVVFFPNENIATDEKNFRSGQLHLTYDLPPEKIAAYRADAPHLLRIDPFLETFYLRFNVARPPLDQRKVRQALSRALDRAAICRTVLRDSRVPAHAFTPPGTAGYTAQAAVPDDFAAARRLLAEAGFPEGKNFPALEVQIKSDDLHRGVLEAVQEMWRRELGIRIIIAPLEQKTWVANQQAMTYQICTSRWAGDYLDPNTFLDMWVTNGGNNQTGWSQPAYDRLIAAAAREMDTPRRQALQQQAEALLLDEAPIAPLFHGARVYLIHPAVKNWQPTLLGLHRYQYVELLE
ncbi:MAG: peptide ABC transporter substrate-binding protein [Opitutae bacterium]|nr:peptide ABC transporter substrate-binding protein [Opitutae bacterium]